MALIVPFLAWFSATAFFVKTLLTDLLGFNKSRFTVLFAQSLPF
jgi:hypothetical protein